MSKMVTPVTLSIPPKWIEPVDYAPQLRRGPYISGIASLMKELRSYDPDYVHTQTVQQQQRLAKSKALAAKEERRQKMLEQWRKRVDLHAIGDPQNTLFVARLAYEVDEIRLQQELSQFGRIERVRIVQDQNNKPRGYAFVVYNSPHAVKAAVRGANSMLIGGRRILVDYERGRTNPRFTPRKVGGGLGGRLSSAEKAAAEAKRQQQHESRRFTPGGPRQGRYQNNSGPGRADPGACGGSSGSDRSGGYAAGPGGAYRRSQALYSPHNGSYGNSTTRPHSHERPALYDRSLPASTERPAAARRAVPGESSVQGRRKLRKY